ncbi:GTPase [Skermanella aerolata]|uniref:hypothetical protein n=1 Tax=Skermanella aerolata TaxID=393310 RepID=UPI003D1BF7B5
MIIETNETFDYRGLTVIVWRTDDPMEAPSDDLEAEGPFETGDFYCAVVEWGLQTGATLTTAAKAGKFVTTAIDAVMEVGMSKETALRIGDIDPIVYEPEVLSSFAPR